MKERLIKRIQETTDPDLLKEVYRLLEIDFDDQEIYELSDAQRAAIIEGEQQIKQGEYLTHEQANEAVKKWLNEK
ncbi:MAG: hypothetical protein KI791_08425 [Cyclobacteriaceae bacterium]|nr:hypothetical protein [Cyclobacteriaceae bacterium SS2]